MFYKFKLNKILVFLLFLYPLIVVRVQAAGISGADLFVVDCSNQNLTLRFLSNKVPQAVRTRNIRGESTSSSAVAWSIVWQPPQLSLPAIKEYQAIGTVSGTCPSIGRYIVPLTLAFAENTTEELEIQVVRIADPILDFPSTITLRSELPVSSGRPSVPSIRLREISGGASIQGLFASGGQLKNASGEVIDTLLYPSFNSPIIKAGQGTDLNLRLSDTPPVGIYTTRLMVHSPGLKQMQAIDVTYKVSFLRCYLAITIFAGVLSGWYVNVQLAGRAALNTTRIEAYRMAGSFERRATAQKDPVVQQRFIALIGTLESEIQTARSSEELQTLMTKGSNEINMIEQEADKASASLHQAISSMQELLQPGQIEVDQMVRQKLEGLIGELSNIRTSALNGDATFAQQWLDEFQSKISHSLTDSLRPWLQDLYGKLYELGEWSEPALGLEQERKSILTLIENSYKISGTQLVSECDKIAVAFRELMIVTGPRMIANAFHMAEITLRTTKPALALSLSTFAIDLIKYSSSSSDPMDVLDKLISTRIDAEMQLQREKPNDPALTTALQIGDFPAAAALISPPVPGALVSLSSFIAPIVRGAPALQSSETVDLSRPRILVPPILPLFRSSEVILDWPQGSSNSVIAWKARPEAIATVVQHRNDNKRAEISPRYAGLITVIAEISGGPTVQATTFAGTVTQTVNFEKLAQDSSRINHIIWAITAIITSVTGYLIFAAAWIGNSADFFSAFIWGFFGQFSLDRVREAVKTVVSRTIS